MLTTFALLALGLILLTAGGEILVRGAVGAARALGVSPLLVGLTLVGFGTSTPELVTSLTAALNGSPGIAVGNVVGSNIANILLILGVTAAVLPLGILPAAFKRDGMALAASTLACLFAVLLGYLDRWLGVVFVLALVGYIVWAYLNERRAPDAEAERQEHMAQDAAPAPGTSVPVALVLAGGGIALTILGARFLVTAAIELAQGLGVSDTVIGLTVVAAGTSLPELVACVVAALRRHADVALGNIVGSNIYNVFGILGVTAIVNPIPVPSEIARVDVWVLVGATALLLLFLRTGWTLKRWEGWAFVGLYVAYIAVLVSNT
jgi:cation:H+ antiporter